MASSPARAAAPPQGISFPDVSSPVLVPGASLDKANSNFRTPGPDPATEEFHSLDSDGVPLAVRESVSDLLEEVEIAEDRTFGAPYTLSDEDEAQDDQIFSGDEEAWLGWCPLEGSTSLDGPLSSRAPSPVLVRHNDCLCTSNVTDRRESRSPPEKQGYGGLLPPVIDDPVLCNPKCACTRHVTGRTAARTSRMDAPVPRRAGIAIARSVNPPIHPPPPLASAASSMYRPRPAFTSPAVSPATTPFQTGKRKDYDTNGGTGDKNASTMPGNSGIYDLVSSQGHDDEPPPPTKVPKGVAPSSRPAASAAAGMGSPEFGAGWQR